MCAVYGDPKAGDELIERNKDSEGSMAKASKFHFWGQIRFYEYEDFI